MVHPSAENKQIYKYAQNTKHPCFVSREVIMAKKEKDPANRRDPMAVRTAAQGPPELQRSFRADLL